MSLFYDVDSPNFSIYASVGESNFSYLNRSQRIEYIHARQRLDQWFFNYPQNHQHELKARFQAKNSKEHLATFFELFLHELFHNLQCKTIIHPNIQGMARKPDFLVCDRVDNKFFVEATLETLRSHQQESIDSIIDAVRQLVNEKIKSLVHLHLSFDRASQQQPSAKLIASSINKKLATVKWDDKPDDLPNWTLENNGWTIRIQPIPRGNYSNPIENPVGMVTEGESFELNDPVPAIRKAISSKATRYSKLEKPYIVALSLSNGGVEKKHFADALFGKAFSKASRTSGVWTDGKQPLNTRLSGVFIVENLLPITIQRAKCTLWLNPWAKYPYKSVLSQFNRMIFTDENCLEERKGIAVSEVLIS